VLGKAKAKGIINEVGPYMDDLVLVSGFRISQSLRKKILDDLGES
jgi:predicted nucleic acid-binding protein